MPEQTAEWDGEGRPQPSVPSTHGIFLHSWVENLGQVKWRVGVNSRKLGGPGMPGISQRSKPIDKARVHPRWACEALTARLPSATLPA